MICWSHRRGFVAGPRPRQQHESVNDLSEPPEWVRVGDGATPRQRPYCYYGHNNNWRVIPLMYWYYQYTFIKSKRTMNMRYSFTSIRNIRNKLRPVPLFLRLNRYWFEFSLFHSSVSSILMFHVLCFVRSNNVSCQPFSLFFCLASFLVCIS